MKNLENRAGPPGSNCGLDAGTDHHDRWMIVTVPPATVPAMVMVMMVVVVILNLLDSAGVKTRLLSILSRCDLQQCPCVWDWL